MPEPGSVVNLEGFFHIRIIIGLVTGLSVTRILTGLARFVQSPEHNRVHGPHIVWSLFLLLYVIHFWWFEFGLMTVTRWEFQDFLFVIGYAALIFFTAALLYPDRIDGYEGFGDYFQARQTWFYGFLISIFVVDIADSLFKGWVYAQALGWPYGLRQIGLIGLAISGLRARSSSFHLALAVAAFMIEITWIIARYRFLE